MFPVFFKNISIICFFIMAVLACSFFIVSTFVNFLDVVFLEFEGAFSDSERRSVSFIMILGAAGSELNRPFPDGLRTCQPDHHCRLIFALYALMRPFP